MKEDQPALVLLPFTLHGELFYRLCFFLGFKQHTIVDCEDSGLLLGKSKRISLFLKHRGQRYLFPAEKATFAFEGDLI